MSILPSSPRLKSLFSTWLATVDGTRALAEAKQRGVPFFLYYLHAALQAVNQIKALRYRIEEG